MKFMCYLGVSKANIKAFDIHGLVYKDRPQMDKYIIEIASEKNDVNFENSFEGADVFLGLSVGGIVKSHYISKMKGDDPLVMALANPTPEIMPDEVKRVKPGAVVCTGRSDYPNQVNNVMAFPYIFRGSLDVRAREINYEMMKGISIALSEIAKKPLDNKLVAQLGNEFKFGKNYIIPNPFDPRLILELPVKVAEAAMATGVARINIDINKYKEELLKYSNPGTS